MCETFRIVEQPLDLSYSMAVTTHIWNVRTLNMISWCEAACDGFSQIQTCCHEILFTLKLIEQFDLYSFITSVVVISSTKENIVTASMCNVASYQQAAQVLVK